jgi:hypothetical protein
MAFVVRCRRVGVAKGPGALSSLNDDSHSYETGSRPSARPANQGANDAGFTLRTPCQPAAFAMASISAGPLAPPT